jgi:hypothetical protein
MTAYDEYSSEDDDDEGDEDEDEMNDTSMGINPADESGYYNQEGLKGNTDGYTELESPKTGESLHSRD